MANKNKQRKENKKKKKGNLRNTDNNVKSPKWQTKSKPKSTVTYANSKRPACHTGNNLVFTYGKGGVYAGGWSRGARPQDNVAVIDLTATEYERWQRKNNDVQARNDSGAQAFPSASGLNKVNSPWLDLYIQDYSAPWELDAEFWANLVDDVKRLLDDGTSILVCCYGGHGRTGLVLSILLGLIRPDLVGQCPIKTVREIYCGNAVESRGQAEYVYLTLGLDFNQLTFNGLGLFASFLDNTANRGAYEWQDVVDDDGNTSDDSTIDQGTFSDVEQVDGAIERRWDWEDGGHTIEYEDGTYQHFEAEDDALTQEYYAIMNGESFSQICQTCQGLQYTEDADGTTRLCNDCDGFGLALTKVC